jgi:hypothetical protein
MDPNAALVAIRKEVTRIMSDPNASGFDLAELVEGLDEWMSKGGFGPKEWVDAKSNLHHGLLRNKEGHWFCYCNRWHLDLPNDPQRARALFLQHIEGIIDGVEPSDLGMVVDGSRTDHVLSAKSLDPNSGTHRYYCSCNSKWFVHSTENIARQLHHAHIDREDNK